MKHNLVVKNMLYAANSKEWRDWLKKHYKTEKEIWLVYYKKHTGKPRISYNDSVEQALCFGWIDSAVKRIDADRYAQRFSRRNPKSRYSQANRERLRKLIREGKVAKEVLATIRDVSADDYEIPSDILKAVKASKQAWKNFQGFSPSYIRIRIAFIDGARSRPREFAKRLRYFIEMTENNKQFGYGGIEKYY